MVYKILRGQSEKLLSDMVNEHLLRGWLLYGNLVGVFCNDGTPEPSDVVDLFQALTRDEPDPFDAETQKAGEEAREKLLKMADDLGV